MRAGPSPRRRRAPAAKAFAAALPAGPVAPQVMADRDYYRVLGVTRSATADEVKRAFRDLARKLHPDVNKAPDAARRFAEVQQAYDVLSDTEKRATYDRFGTADPRAAAAGRASASPGYQEPWSVDHDAASDLGSMFDAFFGGRRAAGGRPARGAPAGDVRGADLQHELRLDFETAARGGTRTVRIATRDGGTRTIDVTIPPAIADGSKLRVRGEGYHGGGVRGRSGDLVLIIRVEPHPLFRRGRPGEAGEGPDALDLTFELPLTMVEATLGGKFVVPTLEGPADLVVPPGTGSGRRLRLRGKGLRLSTDRVGDLYAVVQIVVPRAEELNEAERDTLEGLGHRLASPRTGAGWP